MVEVEPVLVQFCLQLDAMNQSIDRDTFICLANSIIKDTPTEKRVIEYKKRQLGYKEDAETAGLGVGYYSSFMKRHKNELWSIPPKAQDIMRTNWLTYSNVEKMYDSVYKQMEKSGVARKLNVPVFMDADGNVVEDESNALEE